jgi:hypothetical protein
LWKRHPISGQRIRPDHAVASKPYPEVVDVQNTTLSEVDRFRCEERLGYWLVGQRGKLSFKPLGDLKQQKAEAGAGKDRGPFHDAPSLMKVKRIDRTVVPNIHNPK